MATETTTNQSLQIEELEALSAIFGEDWVLESDTDHIYSLNIKDKVFVDNSVYFQVTLPKDYPLESPPNYIISAPWMSRAAKKQLDTMLADIYWENKGESIIYLWILKIQDLINKPIDTFHLESPDNKEDEELSALSYEVSNVMTITDEVPEIHHGEPITDRGSVFQAHVAKVTSPDQVNPILCKLKENRKIATATHNMYAFRLKRENGSYVWDCADDGEQRAGFTLAHLLELVGAENVLVVVTRWYGGIRLGPDRFKHMNNAAKILLSERGFISEKSKDIGNEKTKLKHQQKS